MISQGDIRWADLGIPVGSAPGYHRPMVVVQGDSFNRSRIATVVCIPLTSNLRLAEMPGNVELSTADTGLPTDSVANVSQPMTLDRCMLTKAVGRLTDAKLELILSGLDIVLGR